MLAAEVVIIAAIATFRRLPELAAGPRGTLPNGRVSACSAALPTEPPPIFKVPDGGPLQHEPTARSEIEKDVGRHRTR